MIRLKNIFFPVIFLLVFNAVDYKVEGSSRLKTGIEVLAREHPEIVRGKKLALLTARTAVDRELNHTIDRLAKAASIKLIITGDSYFREKMPDESGQNSFDALTNARIIEINDPLKRPSADVFSDSELLVIDFQDIGIRYFKYLTIMAQLLDLAREASLPVIVLDRPNPINGTTVAGPVLDVSLRSRFGVYPIPLIHGMTIGELALFFNKSYGLGANLTVIGMEGYHRNMSFRETALHWVPPSDHIPEPETPIYYAATGFLGELGVFSTGVGTNRPFRYVLAPWLDGEMLARKLERYKIPGVRFIPASEKIYYGLFANRTIGGVEIVINNFKSFDPPLAGMAILKSLYEMNAERIPLTNPAAAEALDTLLGNRFIRNGIVSGQSLMEIYSSTQRELGEFIKKRREFLIYPE